MYNRWLLPEWSYPIFGNTQQFIPEQVSERQASKNTLARNQEVGMPFVNIRITRDGATPEQKAELIKRTTQMLVEVLGKNPATTVVVIDEVDTDNWGIGGETVTARRLKDR
jgi:4-oxalocrotonate tautomerase